MLVLSKLLALYPSQSGRALYLPLSCKPASMMLASDANLYAIPHPLVPVLIHHMQGEAPSSLFS